MVELLVLGVPAAHSAASWLGIRNLLKKAAEHTALITGLVMETASLKHLE